jgi:hypothetical protein
VVRTRGRRRDPRPAARRAALRRAVQLGAHDGALDRHRRAPPEPLEHEDVADAFGEIANVVGGNVKAALPGPSVLGLPEVGDAPAVRNPADVCRVDVLWRGQPLTISVQGILPPLPAAQPHNEGTAALPENGASL